MFSQISRVFFFLKYFSSDATFIIAIFAIVFALGLYFGKARLVAFILSIYPATFLYNNFPFLGKLVVLHGEKLTALNEIVIFLLFLIPLNIIIDRYIFSESTGGGLIGTAKVGGLALAVTLLIVIFSYNTLSYDVFHNFSDQIDLLFATPARLFYWNLVPIALLAFL